MKEHVLATREKGTKTPQINKGITSVSYITYQYQYKHPYIPYKV